MSDGPGELSLRPVGPGDRALLYGWANDAVTRAASFHPEPIEPAIHDAWFARLLASRRGRIWIGEIGGRPIGQVRVDRVEKGRGEVGISVASSSRGRGFGRALLSAGMVAAERELGVATFVAAVRPDNATSLALFRAAGFSDESDGERAGIACRILVLDRSVPGQ